MTYRGRMLTALAVTALWSASAAAKGTVVRVGSKSFTEGILLGEVATQMIRQAGLNVVHERLPG